DVIHGAVGGSLQVAVIRQLYEVAGSWCGIGGQRRKAGKSQTERSDGQDGTARKRRCEGDAKHMPSVYRKAAPDVVGTAWREPPLLGLRVLLRRIPELYRVAVVFGELQARTREAEAQLGAVFIRAGDVGAELDGVDAVARKVGRPAE